MSDYVSLNTLARRLEMSSAQAETLVRQGLLPPPVNIGNNHRWRWEDVDRWCRASAESRDLQGSDPYMRGAANVSELAPRGSPRHVSRA